MRILLSCYYFSPYRGGEAAVGWNIATRLAAYHDVTVLYGDLSEEQPMKTDIERYQDEQAWPERLTAIHVASDPRTRWIHDLHSKPGLFFLYYVAYKRWQQTAFETAQDLHAKAPFDLVHHLNIIGYREPGYMWNLGIPFFWGPISGAPQIPPSFLKEYSPLQRLRWVTRNLVNQHQILGSKRCRAAAAAASRIWCVSEEDRAMIRSWGFQAQHLLETGAVNTLHAALPIQRKTNEPLKLVWSGQFLGIKALPLVLRAIKRLPACVDVTLDVLGSGAEQNLWLRKTQSLALESKVTFHGFLPKDEAMAVMRKAHVLVHSSVKEGTPHVVLEALSMGLPVICHNACGMGIAVTDDCGIRIPLCNPETSIDGFFNAIKELHDDRLRLTRLSQGALARARNLSWNQLVRSISEAYHAANCPKICD